MLPDLTIRKLSSETHAGRLVCLLAACAAGAYAIVLPLLSDNGPFCDGPPAGSLAGQLVFVAPVLLIVGAVAAIIRTAIGYKWRLATTIWAVVSLLLVAGLLEVVVLAIEYVADGCSPG
jgi:hypothetical protein